MAKVASLFGGIGGLDYGFKTNGYEIGIANESNPIIKEIYSLNNPGVWVNENDLDGVCACGYQHRQPTGLIGTLPEDKEEKALGHYARILTATRPVFFVLVIRPTIEPDEANPEFRKISDALGEKGYDIFVQKINEAAFGSSYSIDHTFLIGFREDANVADFNFPAAPLANEKVDVFEATIDGVNARQIAANKGFREDFFLNGKEDDETVKQAVLATVPPSLAAAIASAVGSTVVNVVVPISKLS